MRRVRCIALIANIFVDFNEQNRYYPIHDHQEIYQVQKELIHAVSRRFRGLDANDPFAIRNQLI